MLTAKSKSSGQSRRTQSDPLQSSGQSVGRPRLLTREKILDAVSSLGLADITMKKVAAELGVGTATLYQYFSSRGELLRAAALHAVEHIDLPEDTGQSWADYALEYARSLQRLFAENPTYIHHHQNSDYGFMAQFNMIEGFLLAMQTRNVSSQDALRLFNAVSMAAIAGGVELARERAFADRGIDMKAAAKDHIEKRPDELPNLSKIVSAQMGKTEDRINDLILPLIRELAAKRGETLTKMRGDYGQN